VRWLFLTTGQLNDRDGSTGFKCNDTALPGDSPTAIARNQLVDTSIYIDLNPVATKIAETPETSDYISIKQRADHVATSAQTAQLEAAKGGSVAGSQAAAGLEESLWLCPIEDRHGLDSTREGMVQGFSLGSYVKLVDYTGRLFRQGKASISAELAEIFERLGCNAQSWQNRMEQLRGGSLLDHFFATTHAKLWEIAERLGVRHVVNLAGCPVR
jgi:hypothetical protein